MPPFAEPPPPPISEPQPPAELEPPPRLNQITFTCRAVQLFSSIVVFATAAGSEAYLAGQTSVEFAVLASVVLMVPEQGAVTQLYLSTSPQAASFTGKYFHPQAREMTPSAYVSERNQEDLWELSEELVRSFVQ